LSQSDEFIIYTTPPSLVDLRAVLEVVKPKKVYVIGNSPQSEKAEVFLSRLAGMTKYAINNKQGKVSIMELISATAQREMAVRIGLEWLAAGGHISIVGDGSTLSAGNGEANQYLQKELFTAVKGILDETTAYRAYFAKADINNLMG
jgi:ornithine cyclodeaminase/alanine dehydrogenase-like protein (mu-crystallin family)